MLGICFGLLVAPVLAAPMAWCFASVQPLAVLVFFVISCATCIHTLAIVPILLALSIAQGWQLNVDVAS